MGLSNALSRVRSVKKNGVPTSNVGIYGDISPREQTNDPHIAPSKSKPYSMVVPATADATGKWQGDYPPTPRLGTPPSGFNRDDSANEEHIQGLSQRLQAASRAYPGMKRQDSLENMTASHPIFRRQESLESVTSITFEAEVGEEFDLVWHQTGARAVPLEGTPGQGVSLSGILALQRAGSSSSSISSVPSIPRSPVRSPSPGASIEAMTPTSSPNKHSRTASTSYDTPASSPHKLVRSFSPSRSDPASPPQLIGLGLTRSESWKVLARAESSGSVGSAQSRGGTPPLPPLPLLQRQTSNGWEKPPLVPGTPHQRIPAPRTHSPQTSPSTSYASYTTSPTNSYPKIPISAFANRSVQQQQPVRPVEPPPTFSILPDYLLSRILDLVWDRCAEHGMDHNEMRVWSACSLVCRRWATHFRSWPLRLRFPAALDSAQLAFLQHTNVPVRSIQWAFGEQRAQQVLESTGFRQASEHSLQAVTRMPMAVGAGKGGAAEAGSLALTGFRNLETLQVMSGHTRCANLTVCHQGGASNSAMTAKWGPGDRHHAEWMRIVQALSKYFITLLGAGETLSGMALLKVCDVPRALRELDIGCGRVQHLLLPMMRVTTFQLRRLAVTAGTTLCCHVSLFEAAAEVVLSARVVAIAGVPFPDATTEDDLPPKRVAELLKERFLEYIVSATSLDYLDLQNVEKVHLVAAVPLSAAKGTLPADASYADASTFRFSRAVHSSPSSGALFPGSPVGRSPRSKTNGDLRSPSWCKASRRLF